MNVPRKVFREYDIRGIVGAELTPEFALALGQAFASHGWKRMGRAPVLAVGRDNRPSGQALAHGIRQGIRAAGGTAVDIGMVPTPALYFAVHHLQADGGIQVTGSHNPPEFNGFKMVLAGDSVHGDEILGLYDLIVAEAWKAEPGSERTDASILEGYRDAILSRHRMARPVKVVVDCGNGVASVIAVRTLTALGCDVVPLFCESDGTFPNHHPDPTMPENLEDLIREVRRSGAELGVAFDGDGDRIGAVDEDGTILFGDQLLVVLGRDAVRRFGPGISVIFDVKCSEVLPRALAAAGAKPQMWKTGHSLIKAKMKELKAPLAGEMSGHIFFGGDYLGYDDALFAAARLLEIVASGAPGLKRLIADLPRTFATPELRIDCPDELKAGIVDKAIAEFAARYSVNTIDGIRIAYPDGWALLRSSNTQPALVMRFEATNPESLARYQTEMRTWLATQGVEA